VRRCVGIVLRGVPDATAVPAAKILDVSSLAECFQKDYVRRIARRALPLEHRRILLSDISSRSGTPAKKLAVAPIRCTLFRSCLRIFRSYRQVARVAFLPGTTVARRRRFVDLQPCTGCVRCRGHGWLCEQHPHCYWPHDDCVGPGIPCDATGCLAEWLARRVKREHARDRRRYERNPGR
jgi:hypothetical protein